MRLYKALMAALPHRAAPSENQTQDPAGPGTLLVQGPCWSKDPAGPRTLVRPSEGPTVKSAPNWVLWDVVYFVKAGQNQI